MKKLDGVFIIPNMMGNLLCKSMWLIFLAYRRRLQVASPQLVTRFSKLGSRAPLNMTAANLKWTYVMGNYVMALLTR